MQIQRALFSIKGDGGTQTLIRDVSPDACRVSRFNARQDHDHEQVRRLAARMVRNGFEMTRALWVYKDGDVFEVFAGGTRLAAAHVAGVNVDVILHDGYTWEDISRFSDQDNQNDEYHLPVTPPDVWADYARLRDVEGWAQKKIAQVKGVDEADVSRRLQFHDLPDEIKGAVVGENCPGLLTERHLKAVFAKIAPAQFLTRWCDVPTWRIEVLTDALAKPKSSRQLAAIWKTRKEAADRAAVLLDGLPDGARDEYTFDAGEVVRVPVDWREVFVDALTDDAARTVAYADAAYTVVVNRRTASSECKETYEQGLDRESLRMAEEQKKIEYIQARWKFGSCLEHLHDLDDGAIRLLLTDPPYGVDFLSNRRTVSGDAPRLQNDGDEATAIQVFSDMLTAVQPKLADEAHLLIFAHWRTEFAFRHELEARGFVVRGSLVWVKENHTSGDLVGSFAPRHERIIHATKGRPDVAPRIDDVLTFAREGRTEHPTEKPLALLKALINSTTARGQLVCDPFGGVGSTVQAAEETERNGWGCEIEEDWWTIGYKELGGG